MEVVNFGCRMNVAEADVLRRVPSEAVVVNTCAVTGEAVRQSLQAVRRLVRERPDTAIVVTGCAATLDPARFAALGARVVANDGKMAAAAYVWAPLTESGYGTNAASAHTRAFVAVQTGCDHACTFCIIPAARGAARAFDTATVVDDIKRLTDASVREVVLTGVDLTSHPALGALVQRILRDVPGLPRLRLSSLDSIEVDEALVEAIADPRVMPQLHLSLQSGDDLILKRMKRRHVSAQAVAFCARLRRVRPDIVFGADFITGFPTETEAMFANTLAHVDACELSQLHVFPYSARAGTPAARMPQLPVELRRERARRLRALGAERLQGALAAQVGRRQRILVEAGGTTGHSEHYLPARLLTPRPRGDIATVTAVAVRDNELECA